MLHSNFTRNNSGFTLVELMVTVAITGALSVVAVPNYLKYTAKSRQTEAKIALSAIYTSEKQFGLEWGSYTTCLDRIGYAPGTGDRYYAVGFKGSAAVLPQCNPTANTPCHIVDGTPCNAGALTGSTGDTFTTAYPATLKAGTTYPKDSDFATNWTGLGTKHFSVGAIGSISSGSVVDKWVIDDNKKISNTQSGI